MDKEKLKEICRKHAESIGAKLNPNREVLDVLLEGLLRNEEKYGYRYCPCRVVSGDPEKDKKIICPCWYHLLEIEKMGRCWCGLFVKPGIEFKKTFTEEEMKAWRKIWDKVDKK